MMAAARALVANRTIVRSGRRKYQASSNRVGQMAKPAPKLKEATKPAQIAITVMLKEQRVLGNRRKPSAAPAIAKEVSQLKSPLAVMLARPIQKLPMTITKVDNIFAVRVMLLSRHTGIRSSATVIK